MKRFQFSTLIQAPREVVWETVIGPVTYRIWTAAFTEGSYFEGTWAKGERMRFLAPGGQGMVSEIAESRPHEFISIKHLGEIKDGVEDTDLTADMDMAESFEEYMTGVWPKALSQLKALCEARAANPQT